MVVQEDDLEARRVFDMLPENCLWMLASMDVNMWNDDGEINKPKGDPYDAIGDLARKMLHAGNRRIGISNILTTKICGERNRRVGWRDAYIVLSHSLIRWMADTDKLIRSVERGDVGDNLITSESNGGLRWDQLISRSLKMGRANQEILSVQVGRMRVGVDSRETAQLASAAIAPYLRSVAPGLQEAAYAEAMKMI